MPTTSSRYARFAALFGFALFGVHCNSVLGISDVPTPVDASSSSADSGRDAATADASDGSSCTPKTCAQLGATACGPQNDGCGNAIDCGSCSGNQACSTAGQCACVPTTCPAALLALLDGGAGDAGATDAGSASDAGDGGATDGGIGGDDAGGADSGAGDGGAPAPVGPVICGVIGDGCGGTLNCGTCTQANESCVDNLCACVPKTCAEQSASCGQVPDGCGGTYFCGSCGGSTPNCTNGACTVAPCVPTTTCSGHCGMTPDGCGNILACGATCTAPETCGGGGTANVCGCTQTTCAALGKNCGSPSNGCGGTLSCGSCTAPETCGGAGIAEICGCTPTTCAALGKNCGAPANGCGGTLSCGTCASPDTCGGGGTTDVCGCSSLVCSSCCGTGVTGCGTTCTRETCCNPCFIAGTRVSMADGSLRAIEQVHVGELVQSYDAATGAVGVARVKEVVQHDAESSTDSIVVIDHVLHLTPNHPLHAGGRQVRADELKVGDELVTAVGGAPVAHRVRSIEVEQGHVPTFDLVVDGPGTFVAEGIIVDIKPPPP